MQLRTLHPGIIARCNQLYFRQSMLKDYLTCPQLSLYRWVLALEEEDPFFAGFLGSAGHKVIFDMHEARKYDYTHLELLDQFCVAFDQYIAAAATLPNVAQRFDTIEEQRDEKAGMYAGLLQGYQSADRNRKFHSTIHEQSFVLEMSAEQSPSANGALDATFDHSDDPAPFLIVGTIDQAGFYDDGTFVLRDIKFRDNAFRPSKTELDLDLQMTVYAAALKFGNPSCQNCKPRYVPDESGQTVLHYNGPCDTCKKQIGTVNWPRKFAERCELIWMRDFEKYQRDEFSQLIKDPNKVQEISPETGRKRIREVINPKWHDGYKEGDYKGPGLLYTNRTPAAIQIFMSDILRICDQMRRGIFFRKPGEQCNFWCKFRKQCVAGIELEVEDVDMQKADVYGTHDPFSNE